MAPGRDKGKNKLALIDSGVCASEKIAGCFFLLVTYIRMILLGLLNYLPFAKLSVTFAI